MKFAEMTRQPEGNDKCPHSQDKHMPSFPQVESTNANHQTISHYQVEHPPQDVHRR